MAKPPVSRAEATIDSQLRGAVDATSSSVWELGRDSGGGEPSSSSKGMYTVVVDSNWLRSSSSNSSLLDGQRPAKNAASLNIG